MVGKTLFYYGVLRSLLYGPEVALRQICSLPYVYYFLDFFPILIKGGYIY